MGMFDFKLDMFCRNCKYYNILRIIIWIMVPTLLLSHPQCLDFRPPFTISEERGAFCTDYTKFGCCTRPQHNAIRQRYDVIAAQLASVNINSNGDGLTSCEGYLKVILCQECSPYAAHLYDAGRIIITLIKPMLYPGHHIWRSSSDQLSVSASKQR